MAFKNYIAPIPLSSIDSSTFTGAYQLLSAAAGIPNACIIIEIVNNSNKDVTISYDGTNNHDFVRAGSDRQYYFQTNNQPQNNAASLPLGTKVYVKGAAGAGLVYLAGYYQPTIG